MGELGKRGKRTGGRQRENRGKEEESTGEREGDNIRKDRERTGEKKKIKSTYCEGGGTKSNIYLSLNNFLIIYTLYT